MLVEVLSPSSEASDRGEKFAHYRRLASLKYVLVAQHAPQVEVFRRAGDLWTLHEHNAGQRVTLESIDVAFDVDELFADPTGSG